MGEDETGFIQTIVPPQTLEHLDRILSLSALIVRGRLQVMGNGRGLVLTQAWPLHGVFGGYEGFPAEVGGRDRFITAVEEAEKVGAAARAVALGE